MAYCSLETHTGKLGSVAGRDTQSRLPAADVRHPDRHGLEYTVLNGRVHTVPVRCGRKVPWHLGAVKRTRMPVKTALVMQNTWYLECLDTQCKFIWNRSDT